MRRINVLLTIVAFLAFVVNSTAVSVWADEGTATVKLRSGKTYQVTKAQIESLKKQPGIEFSEVLPGKLPKGQMAVAIPEELGGGYIIGTSEAIASAFNAAGITVGLTAAAVSGTATIVAGVLGATIAGVIAAALSEGEGAAAHHHAGPHH